MSLGVCSCVCAVWRKDEHFSTLQKSVAKQQVTRLLQKTSRSSAMITFVFYSVVASEFVTDAIYCVIFSSFLSHTLPARFFNTDKNGTHHASNWLKPQTTNILDVPSFMCIVVFFSLKKNVFFFSLHFYLVCTEY